MDLRIFENSGQLLFHLSGRIVLDECDRLKSSILQFLGPKVTQLYLDLSKVDFIDSAGLGALVGIKVSANKHRAKLAIISPSRGVSDILTVSKLDSIFEIITGADAEQIVTSIAKPETEKSIAAGQASPAASRGPAVPSMPATGARPAAAPPDGAKDQIDRLCRDAVEHMRRGDYESAASAYLKAIEINPDYLPAHNNLAIVYEKRPEWHAEAVAQWKRVLDLSSRNNDTKHVDRAKKHLANLQLQG